MIFIIFQDFLFKAKIKVSLINPTPSAVFYQNSGHIRFKAPLWLTVVYCYLYLLCLDCCRI